MTAFTSEAAGCSRRRFLAASAAGTVGMVGVVAAACGPEGSGPGDTSPPPSGERVTIEHYVYVDQAQLERTQALWARFNELHPNIRVEHLPAVGGELEKSQKMQTLVAGGTPPAVVGQIVAQYPSYYVLTGTIEPIDALMTADKLDRRRFSTVAIDTFKYKGAQYALPYGASMEVLAYNKELFDRQGVKRPPSTWDDPTWTHDEFIRRAQALTKAPEGAPEQFGFGRPGAGWTGVPLLWGTEWVSEDLSRYLGTTPAVIASIQARQDYVWKHHIAPQPSEGSLFGALSSSQRFLTGKVAMADLGTWYLLRWMKDATFDWDIAPWPRGSSAQAAAPMFPVGEALGKGTMYRQQAWELIKYFTYRPESNLEYAFLRGAGPALVSNLPAWRTQLTKEKAGVSAQVAADLVAKYGRVARLHFVARYTEVTSQHIGPAVTKVENNEMPAKAALEQVGPQVQQLLGG
ncbi:MAG: extracellular solute-binding protein [Chloroflexota bacterium]